MDLVIACILNGFILLVLICLAVGAAAARSR
jgi:hypothetical protein